MKQYYVLLVLQIMLHYAPYQMLHHCSAIRISVVCPNKAFMPLQDGALLSNKTVL